MIVRAYKNADLNSLTILMGELGYPSKPENMLTRIQRIESIPMYHTFVAEEQGELVGMIGIRQLFSYEVEEVATQISALVTKREFQGKGIGKALVQYVEEWSKKNGSEIIVLTSGIKEERKKAHEFYKSLDFEITGFRFVKKI